ncbi:MULTISPECIES: DNA mismatch repair protein MutS [Rhodomicrobium]|uniref:DNA mismatch repair protein MutS n=1 Tax=Rhodomicrobium TaxID=1068 RepID=UPI000B4A990C|nr:MULTISPECIES: DNA mismatch repair protein MutS [Rhodomicrobium]
MTQRAAGRAIDEESGTFGDIRDVTPAEYESHAAATPMMAQYVKIKAAHADCLLFYRMGDFFELFFDDAVQASRALGIQLTKRGKHLGEDIPMCGVPVIRSDEYLQKLIAAGFRIAVCEQLEDPAEAKKRGGKSVVKRDVVRLVTPGTITEETLLDAAANNFLTALFRSSAGGRGEFALASLDISTGEFLLGDCAAADLPGELARLASREVLMSDELSGDKALRGIIAHAGAALTPLPNAYFSAASGEAGLKAELGVNALDGFGSFSRGELAATGALLKYVEITQIGQKPVMRPPRRAGGGAFLAIDAATRANLEMTRSLAGAKQGSLMAAIDGTMTNAGSRELAARLSSPLTDPAAINARLDAVAFLKDRQMLRSRLRDCLKAAPDIARALSRLALDRGGPRDLGALRDGLACAAVIARLLAEPLMADGAPAEIAAISDRLAAADGALAEKLSAALADELPHLKRDGGFIRAGFSADLDENRRLRDDSRGMIAALQARYAAETGVKGLKIRHNNLLGYFIETTAANAGPLLKPPHSDNFRHRQTLANQVRFTSEELASAEARITGAADRALAIELEVFAALSRQALADERKLSAAAAALADLDVYCALAELAEAQGYCRPEVDASTAFAIEAARHPVVEQALAKSRAGPFIANGCNLSRERLWLVTGPNMAGKSTFLRQNALIVILAQMGSFVPARAAHIGVADRLFSRVGASDDLARGRSTFMVEMVETAAILNQATERSLVILDEIGRGTATFDGLSIAWAAVEHLHNVNKCRALFATHYHELTAMAEKLPCATNVTVAVKEWKDNIVFLHEVVEGAADRSYGIQVAKLAGLPGPVIARARQVLARLEKGQGKPNAEALGDLPLFAALAPAAPKPEPDKAATELARALAALDPDSMSPREALDALYRLKALDREKSAPG